jgi:hypothetical protein
MIVEKRKRMIGLCGILAIVPLFSQAKDLNVVGVGNKVEITHSGAAVSVKPVDKELTTLDNRPKVPLLKIEAGHAAPLYITDANEMLFTYDKTSEFKDLPDVDAIAKFAEALAGALGVKIDAKENVAPSDLAARNMVDALGNDAGALAEQMTELTKFLGQRTEILNDTRTGKDGVNRAKKKVEAWDLDAVNAPLLKAKAVKLSVAEIIAALESVAHLKKFKQEVLELGAAKYVHTIENKTAIQTEEVTITIQPSGKYVKLFDAKLWDHVHSKSGNIRLDGRQKRLVRFMVGAGVVYSFVKDPEFAVAEDDSGTRTVKEDSKEYKEFQGAVMLNIIPEKFYESAFEPYFQVGASPEKDQIGFMAGIGFAGIPIPNDAAGLRRINLSVGVIYQEATKLDGLSTGDVLAKDADLKTKQEYDAGFYIQAGFKF